MQARILIFTAASLFLPGSFPAAAAAEKSSRFDARTARSGNWSDPGAWEGGRRPRSGDRVQVRPGHGVIYDVHSSEPLRMVHVGGTLSFSRDRSTLLAVGLLKVQRGEEASEDGFDCDAHALPGEEAAKDAGDGPQAALEIGTPESPIPAGVTATVRLVHFEGMDPQTLPAIVNCGGRWDIHGSPLGRTWVKLGDTARPGETRVALLEDPSGWRVGDLVIITGSRQPPFRAFGKGSGPGADWGSEERRIAGIEGKVILLDRPLSREHEASGSRRTEAANLSRNVVVESSDPGGARGHTMFHRGSSGGVSYAEFRHLGKEGILGKYPLHFHLVRGTMRGSSVIGASIWDSHNRFLTIHGTDYLLVRDCVGYRSVGHGFFLEDGTEEYNVLDRNLAVQARGGKRLPRQVLPFDPNDGAGFWWANGRNVLVRNVACENEEYGFRFDIQKRSNFDPTLRVLSPAGGYERRDVRTIPFLRFEANESHSEGLYSFFLGEDENPSVRGDRRHPFIARDLLAWETHYALRPNLQFFLMEGLLVDGAAYGVYHPDYDAHVYRSIHLKRVNAEPINRGHDDESIQHGSFTYEDLTIEDCRTGRDPLIQLACTSPREGQAGHFRNVSLKGSVSREGKVVDLGGGPRNEKLEKAVAYYFHGLPAEGRTTRVVSARFDEAREGGGYRAVAGFTGKDVRAAETGQVEFPVLLDPVDDLPPATIITSVREDSGLLRVRGLAIDDGQPASVLVNGREARVTSPPGGPPGVAAWEVELPAPFPEVLEARSRDRAGNAEAMPHRLALRERARGLSRF